MIAMMYVGTVSRSSVCHLVLLKSYYMLHNNYRMSN